MKSKTDATIHTLTEQLAKILEGYRESLSQKSTADDTIFLVKPQSLDESLKCYSQRIGLDRLLGFLKGATIGWNIEINSYITKTHCLSLSFNYCGNTWNGMY